MPAPNWIIIDSPSSTVWSDPAVSGALLRRIAANPENLLRAAASRPVKIDRESLIVQGDLLLGDRSLPVAVKQYRPRSVCKALAAVLRLAKAVENCEKAEFLLSRGVSTPQPLLACRPRGWPASSTSLLVTRWIDGAENLHLFGWRIAARPLAARLRLAGRCAEAFGRLLGRLHKAGAAHRDLKPANLLVVENGCDIAVHLVDLDGLQPGVRIDFQRQVRDLARLAVGLAAHPWVTRSVCGRFLRAYLDEFSEGAGWKALWRAISAEAARLIRRKRERGQEVL